MSRFATLLLVIILTLSSLVVIGSVFAQSIPDFTLKFEAHPYDVPTTYGIDPYTGKTVTIEEGHHVRNESVVFTIKNQPFSNLFYNIRYRGSFGGRWTELYSYGLYSSGSLVPQSNSEYTVISIQAYYPFVNGAEIDFQVQALLWHYIQVFVSDHPMAPPPLSEIGHYEDRFTLSRTSAWSNTQTLTFPLIRPNVALLMPQNANFSTSDVQLDFVVDMPVSQIGYSLDGRGNVTVTGNTTLTGLPNGYHNVTVYAMDESGNTGASETIHFNVEVPEPFPVIPVTTAFVAIVAVIGACLLVYFKKRKR